MSHSQSTRIITVAVFLVSLAIFLYLYLSLPLMHGGDSYYHLAASREYAGGDFNDRLEWARFSVMNENYGDKEFLFHLVVSPFTLLFSGDTGGKIALAVFNAAIASTLCYFCIRAVGLWGGFVPLIVFGTSAAFMLRMTRLRPEIFALFFMLWATWFAANKKYRWLFAVSVLYALSYTAFHAYLGLVFFWFALSRIRHGNWEWKLLAAAVAGVAVGLLIHPGFPSNLLIWKIQSVDYFQLKGQLLTTSGNEISSSPAKVLFQLNWGWMLSLLVISLSTVQKEDRDSNPLLFEFFLTNAVVFSCLYILMQRFSTYCIPFATLAVLFWIHKENRRIGRYLHLPNGTRIAFFIPLCLCLCTSLAASWYVYINLSDHGVFTKDFHKNSQNLRKVIPEKAKIVASWDTAEFYTFSAPQGRYLNVLDPVFMALPNPGRHIIADRILNGIEPDVPGAMKIGLDSDYIIFPVRRRADLFSKLYYDPRMDLVYKGIDAVFRVNMGNSDKFVRNWVVLPPSVPLPPDIETIQNLGQQVNPEMTGYVAHEFGKKDGHGIFCSIMNTDVYEEHIFELASYGPVALWLDQNRIVSLNTGLKAELGKGLRFPLKLSPGKHVLTVKTRQYQGQTGFYLIRR